jgi:hypothetical protein
MPRAGRVFDSPCSVRFCRRSSPTSHYALALFAAVAGAVFAARQILLHIAPGDAGYGSALLGYHYYTWAFIGFAVAIALTAIALLFDRQFAQTDLGKPAGGRLACARCGVACDRACGAQRRFDLVGMRLRRVSGQSGELPASQNRALRIGPTVTATASARHGSRRLRPRRRPSGWRDRPRQGRSDGS